MRKVSALLVALGVTFAAFSVNTPQAHAALPAPNRVTVKYTVTSDPAHPPLIDVGTLAGGTPTPSGGPDCVEITLTRTENYLIYHTTDYQAHLNVCRQWNVLAYGGVVWNVSWLMWVDHLKPTLNWGGGVLSNGHYQYSCVWTPWLGRTVCGDHLGFRIDTATAIQQCFGFCLQTETITAWMQVYDNGQWIGDLNHN